MQSRTSMASRLRIKFGVGHIRKERDSRGHPLGPQGYLSHKQRRGPISISDLDYMASLDNIPVVLGFHGSCFTERDPEVPLLKY